MRTMHATVLAVSVGVGAEFIVAFRCSARFQRASDVQRAGATCVYQPNTSLRALPKVGVAAAAEMAELLVDGWVDVVGAEVARRDSAHAVGLVVDAGVRRRSGGQCR